MTGQEINTLLVQGYDCGQITLLSAAPKLGLIQKICPGVIFMPTARTMGILRLRPSGFAQNDMFGQSNNLSVEV